MIRFALKPSLLFQDQVSGDHWRHLWWQSIEIEQLLSTVHAEHGQDGCSTASRLLEHHVLASCDRHNIAVHVGVKIACLLLTLLLSEKRGIDLTDRIQPYVSAAVVYESACQQWLLT